MADEEQLAILGQGVGVWNKWREENPFTNIDLSGAYLAEANLGGINFNRANLRKANLVNADLCWSRLAGANFSEAYLCGAYLRGANLIRADFSESYLNDADLGETYLNRTSFVGADLSGAYLVNAVLINADLERANLANCRVHGISAWRLKLKGAIQENLIITSHDEPTITVDNIEIAQFIYILLHNEKIRDVIDTVGKKAVLILGRFTPERKVVLDAIREELRKRDYLPILFDFEKPASRDLTETISTLAHMSRFIIADVTEARSIPAELQCIIPNLPSVPVVPLVLASEHEYALFEHIRRYPWVLEPYRYGDQAELIASIGEMVIIPAEAKIKELRDK